MCHSKHVCRGRKKPAVPAQVYKFSAAEKTNLPVEAGRTDRPVVKSEGLRKEVWGLDPQRVGKCRESPLSQVRALANHVCPRPGWAHLLWKKDEWHAENRGFMLRARPVKKWNTCLTQGQVSLAVAVIAQQGVLAKSCSGRCSNCLQTTSASCTLALVVIAFFTGE